VASPQGLAELAGVLVIAPHGLQLGTIAAHVPSLCGLHLGPLAVHVLSIYGRLQYTSARDPHLSSFQRSVQLCHRT